MTERQIGIRELKSRLSECVRQVKTGHTLVVTEHGHPVARIIPDAASLHRRLDTLVTTGGILWSGRRLGPVKSGPRVRGKQTVAELLSENRG